MNRRLLLLLLPLLALGIAVWRVKLAADSWRPQLVLAEPRLRSFALSPDGQWMAVAAGSRSYLFRLTDVSRVPLPGDYINEWTFSPDGHLILGWSACSRPGTGPHLTVCEVPTGRPIWRFLPQYDDLTLGNIVGSPVLFDDETVQLAMTYGILVTSPVPGAKNQKQFSGRSGKLQILRNSQLFAFTPGKKLIRWSNDDKIRDAEYSLLTRTKAILHESEFYTEVSLFNWNGVRPRTYKRLDNFDGSALRISPDGQYLAIMARTSSMFDTRTWKSVWSTGEDSLRFVGDGRVLVFNNFGNHIDVRNVLDGSLIRTTVPMRQIMVRGPFAAPNSDFAYFQTTAAVYRIRLR